MNKENVMVLFSGLLYFFHDLNADLNFYYNYYVTKQEILSETA